MNQAIGVAGAKARLFDPGYRIGLLTVIGHVIDANQIPAEFRRPVRSKGGWIRALCDCGVEVVRSTSTLFYDLRSDSPRPRKNAACSKLCKSYQAIKYAKERGKFPSYNYRNLVSACRRTGRELKITIEEYVTIRDLDSTCHYCGSQISKHSVGLDRKDSRLGYEPSNVVPCCAFCNDAKGHLLSYSEFCAAMRVRISRLGFGESPWDGYKWRTCLDNSGSPTVKRRTEGG